MKNFHVNNLFLEKSLSFSSIFLLSFSSSSNNFVHNPPYNINGSHNNPYLFQLLTNFGSHIWRRKLWLLESPNEDSFHLTRFVGVGWRRLQIAERCNIITYMHTWRIKRKMQNLFSTSSKVLAKPSFQSYQLRKPQKSHDILKKEFQRSKKVITIKLQSLSREFDNLLMKESEPIQSYFFRV